MKLMKDGKIYNTATSRLITKRCASHHIDLDFDIELYMTMNDEPWILVRGKHTVVDSYIITERCLKFEKMLEKFIDLPDEITNRFEEA